MANALDAANSIFGSVHEDIEYKLTITDVADSSIRIASFKATENISQLFRYTIAVATDPEQDTIAGLEEALGRDATFTITKDGEVARVVHGIVTAVQPDGTFIGKTQARVLIVLEPRMANLRYSGGFRIFQDMAIHEIVNAICQTEQIECLWHVHGVPPKREYCTQFNESDYEFIKRLASEEGMHFFFQHDDKKATLVFCNDPDGYEEIEKDLALYFHDDIGAVDREHVRSIRREQGIRTGAVEHRDYNFIEPKKGLVARAETQGKETTANSHKRELRDYPGRYVDKDDVGKKLAQLRLEELRSDAFVFAGTASSLRLRVGTSFTLEGHRDDAFNRKLLITQVIMEGSVQGAQGNGGGFRGSNRLTSFSAVPAEIPIHPNRLEKPVSRLQSARVVGPKDGDPYVDEYGRVKVQFFWDRDGKFDEKSSCWVRMMTPVAHLDEGFWQAHKVGSEVVVGFIDDDIDRPMILGAVYNTVQSQLYPLPQQVSKSVWRTKSIPGNAGFNEITHDNTSGKEEIYIHAQRDRRTMVLHNHTETVGANQTSTIGANQTISVGAARKVTVGATQNIEVMGKETYTVHGEREETVHQKETVTIKQDRTHKVEGSVESLTVTTGKREVKVPTGDSRLEAKSNNIVIQTKYDLNALESVTIHSDTDSTLTLKPNEATLRTKTSIILTNDSGTITMANGKITISAKEEVALDAGGSAKVSLKKDGTLTVDGPTKLELGSKSSTVVLEPAKAVVNGAAVNVTASGMMEISGALIKIN